MKTFKNVWMIEVWKLYIQSPDGKIKIGKNDTLQEFPQIWKVNGTAFKRTSKEQHQQALRKKTLLHGIQVEDSTQLRQATQPFKNIKTNKSGHHGSQYGRLKASLKSKSSYGPY